MNNKGFTLAEVLITLVIIGVTAAITVTSLIQSTQKQEYVQKLKKSYSTLQQAVYRISLNDGYPVFDFSDYTEDKFFESFIKEVNYVKLCKDSADGCYYEEKVKYLNGDTDTGNYDRKNSIVTSDGILYQWNNSKTLCSTKGLSEEDIENCIGRFIVDINGFKKPNKFGLDIFVFGIVNGKGAVPAGSGDNSKNCKRSAHGVDCAAKVLKEGAINY